MKNSVNSGKTSSGFEKRILSIVPLIQPYVKHRLYTAETSGIIPHNMYKSHGIIDNAIINLYDKYNGKLSEELSLKLELFSVVNENLDELFKKEAFHKTTLSTSKILENELKELDEKFEADIDWDLLMREELDDISYNQNKERKSSFFYEDSEQNIVNALAMDDFRGKLSDKNILRLNKIYNWLPLETSNILDLLVFGKLTYEEISKVKNISVHEVKSIIKKISKNFRKNLN